MFQATCLATCDAHGPQDALVVMTGKLPKEGRGEAPYVPSIR
jgi:hypothetical protein